MSDSVTTSNEQIVRHPDGRRIGVSIFGDPGCNQVLFYSHGFPSSRLEALLAHQTACELGLTIVALDRPGFGRSDWYRGRCLEDWALDVKLVADQLGIKRFGVLGVSGGTPTAIAAAARLKDRVILLAVVSGIAPFRSLPALEGMNAANRLVLQVGRKLPFLGRWMIAAIATLWRINPIFALLWFRALLPEQDLRIGRRRRVSQVMSQAIHEGLRQGVQGALTDFELLFSDWGYLLAEVRAPSFVWHGDSDTYVPPGMGEVLAQGIPGCKLQRVGDGGHFMIVDELRDVLGTILSHMPRD